MTCEVFLVSTMEPIITPHTPPAMHIGRDAESNELMYVPSFARPPRQSRLKNMCVASSNGQVRSDRACLSNNGEVPPTIFLGQALIQRTFNTTLRPRTCARAGPFRSPIEPAGVRHCFFHWALGFLSYQYRYPAPPTHTLPIQPRTVVVGVFSPQ